MNECYGCVNRLFSYVNKFFGFIYGVIDSFLIFFRSIELFIVEFDFRVESFVDVCVLVGDYFVIFVYREECMCNFFKCIFGNVDVVVFVIDSLYEM